MQTIIQFVWFFLQNDPNYLNLQRNSLGFKFEQGKIKIKINFNRNLNSNKLKLKYFITFKPWNY